jgi:hypothetical protein
VQSFATSSSTLGIRAFLILASALVDNAVIGIAIEDVENLPIDFIGVMPMRGVGGS